MKEEILKILKEETHTEGKNNNMEEIQPVRLTKKAINSFIGWTTSRYNDYLGFGSKKENVETVYESIGCGFYTKIYFKKDGTRVMSETDVNKTVFEIECASPVGESGTNKRGSYWKTKQAGDHYTVDCMAKTITAKYSKRVIKFI
jgi:hypothetical protein